jgi:hydantoinase/carbamoylase family amidase
MAMRHDALVAAANFAAETERIASSVGDPFVATVGVFEVKPGGINTIPGSVSYSLDIRDLDMERREKGARAILDAADRCAARFGATHAWQEIKKEKSAALSTRVIAVIENSCRDAGEEYLILPSGAFHDSLAMSEICDTGMIFVPSRDGVSHSPFEYTSRNDIFLGAELLYRTLVKLATSA